MLDRLQLIPKTEQVPRTSGTLLSLLGPVLWTQSGIISCSYSFTAVSLGVSESMDFFGHLFYHPQAKDSVPCTRVCLCV